MKRFNILILLCALLTLTACKHWWSGGSDDDDDGPFKGMTAKQLYTEAKEKLAKKQYTETISRLEALDTMYPFNDNAEQAEMDLIYAYYMKEEYPAAAASAEHYIHLYPRAKHVDYAYYMKGLANFNQVRGALANIFPMDRSKRDPGTQAQSYSDFASLVQKFPSSRYKPNALQRMIYLRNMFAQRELNGAYYYYDRRMYVAAEERASYVLKTYPQAPNAKDALAVVYYSDLAMGLHDAAQDALTVYQKTYHHNPKKIKDHSQEL
ncbi:MAG: outer membrane protein assembly factor BamD [Gammaproteobacteria bacterium]|nr:outer membrane protein assembly factor BamD [Gammaproteobacteria bacterium]